MKKFFAIAILATAFVACNGGGEKKEGEKKDTTPAVAPVVDTTKPAVADTTMPAAPAADTTKK